MRRRSVLCGSWPFEMKALAVGYTLRALRRRHANCRKNADWLSNHSETIANSMNESPTVQILADPQIKRADLHCHSRYSVFKYFRRANTRDCYNAPEDV